MHSFLRSVGFSNIKDRKGIDELIRDVCLNCDTRNAVRLDHGQAFVEYRKEFGPGFGLAVCGELDESGFHQDYYFPYFIQIQSAVKKICPLKSMEEKIPLPVSVKITGWELL